MFKTTSNAVLCFGFLYQLGNRKTTDFGLFYDTSEKAKRFEPKYTLARRGLLNVKRTGRKQKKERKNRQNTVRGAAKATVGTWENKK